MKTIYFLLLSIFIPWSTISSQNLTVISKQRAEKIAQQRNYNEEETERFIQRATSKGVNLEAKPLRMLQPNSVNSTATNLDFELANFSGWSGNYTTSNCTSPTPNVTNVPGFNFTSLNVTTDQHGLCNAGYDPSVTTGQLPCVNPFSGLVSCRLGDVLDGCGAANISQSFTVTGTDTMFTVYYALVLFDGHPPQDAPKFIYTIKDSTGFTIDSFYVDATTASQPGSGFVLADSSNSLLYYKPWGSRNTSIAAYVGQAITVNFISSDCNGGAHRGYAYIDCAFNGGSPSCGTAQTPGICYVNTNDSLHNEIYFNHPLSILSGGGTIIYRLNSMSTWDSIGKVPFGQPDVFIDTIANPNQQSYTYCVAAYDSCGTTYAKSSPHTTIFLQSSLGTNSSINLSWNQYIGTTVPAYKIYRGTSTSNMSFLNQVSSSTTAYTDLNPPTGNVFYRINFKAPINCTSNSAQDTLVGSNYKTNTVTGLINLNEKAITSIYPNPANAQIIIEMNSGSADISISDMMGNVVKQSKAKQGKNSIDIRELPEGIYLVSIKDTAGKVGFSRRLAIQR